MIQPSLLTRFVLDAESVVVLRKDKNGSGIDAIFPLLPVAFFDHGNSRGPGKD
jgi:hypothetical protein